LGRLDASKNAAIAVHRGQRLHRRNSPSLSHGDFIDRAECVAAIACAGKFIANFILPRVSEMSGPYQMFGQLFDVYFLSKEMNVNSDEGWLLRYEEVPRDFIPELVESARKEMIHNLVSSFCHAIHFREASERLPRGVLTRCASLLLLLLQTGIFNKLPAEEHKKWKRDLPQLGQYFTVGFTYGEGYGGYDERGHVRDTLRPDRIVRPFDESHPSGPGVRSNFLHPVFRCE